MPRTDPRTKLTNLEEKRKRIEAEARKAKAEIRSEERKRDTRRKILLGAAMIAWAEQGRGGAHKAIRAMIADMPERDRAAFESWTPPTPPTGDV
jgi:hypothetical protein